MNILTVLDNCPWNEYTFASVKGYLPSLTIMSVLWLLYRLFFGGYLQMAVASLKWLRCLAVSLSLQKCTF